MPRKTRRGGHVTDAVGRRGHNGGQASVVLCNVAEDIASKSKVGLLLALFCGAPFETTRVE